MNPDCDPAIEWIPEREAAGDKRIMRCYWTEYASGFSLKLEHTIGVAESELTTNNQDCTADALPKPT